MTNLYKAITVVVAFASAILLVAGTALVGALLTDNKALIDLVRHVPIVSEIIKTCVSGFIGGTFYPAILVFVTGLAGSIWSVIRVRKIRSAL